MVIQKDKPIVVVNFKTYPGAVNENALKLARCCENISKDIIICVNSIDVKEVSNNIDNLVFSQHVDNASLGSSTGKIVPEILLKTGIKGSLLNHSENRVPLDQIKDTITKCKEVGIFTLLCAQSDEEAMEIAKFGPDAIAVEPPELIGGDISVTSANPDIIKNTVEKVSSVDSSIMVLCGAGVKTSEDVRKAIELGAKGVLLASGVTKAENPEEVLRDLISGLN